jgi:ribonucleoside-diphosphate reductase beta chain
MNQITSAQKTHIMFNNKHMSEPLLPQEIQILQVKKRNGAIVEFDVYRIQKAIEKAFDACHADGADIHDIVTDIYHSLQLIQYNHGEERMLTVEHIQDEVEKNLIKFNKYEVAKTYILYREKRSEMRKPDIFRSRINLRPYEYPELYEYVSAIRHSYWIHTEFNYTPDVQDFKVNINDAERHVIKHTMLAIAQIEVTVKSFWGNIYKRMPKPEIAAV